MKLSRILPVLLLCSCQVGMYESLHEQYAGGVIAVRNRVRDVNLQGGGTRSVRRADGSSEVNDYQQSARDFFSAVGVGFSTWSYAAQQTAKFAYQKYQAGQITQQQFNAQMNAIKLQELKNAGQAVPAGESVLNNGTILTAPK